MSGLITNFLAVSFVGSMGALVVTAPPPDYLLPTGSVTLEEPAPPKPRDRFDESRLTDAINEIAPKYGIPPLLFFAMLDVESAGDGWRNNYEPHVYDQQKRKHPKASRNELRFRATSHCALQVMGYHALDSGYAPQDVYDPEVCVELASKVFAGFLPASRKRITVAALREAIIRYNGPKGRGVYDVKVIKALEARLDKEIRVAETEARKKAEAELAALKLEKERKFKGLFGEG